MKKATIICDMQFGSTGKGLLAGILAKEEKPDVIMTAWGANAGHTFTDKDGTKFVHTALANGVISESVEHVLIGPGSVVNISNLIEEIEEFQRKTGMNVAEKIRIHENCGIIAARHVDESRPRLQLGSTRKGTGPCLREKLSRPRDRRVIASHYTSTGPSKYLENATIKHTDGVDAIPLGLATQMVPKFAEIPVPVWSSDVKSLDGMVISHSRYMNIVKNARRILVEGAQGYSLGVNSGLYPFTTHRECTPAQICSDVLLPLPMVDKVWGVCRTFPIRVANRFDSDGYMVGYSGPGYPDQKEISFHDIGVAPEFTTVTKLKRRIFTFSQIQFNQAFDAIQPTGIFVNFVNYLDSLKKVDLDCHQSQIEDIYRSVFRQTIANNLTDVKFGYGPSEMDVRNVDPTIVNMMAALDRG